MKVTGLTIGKFMNPEKNLQELGLTLPQPPAAAGAYVPAVRTGNLLYLAGTLPMRDGKIVYGGKVGQEINLVQAAEAAQLCTLNALANAKAALGSLDARSKYWKVRAKVVIVGATAAVPSGEAGRGCNSGAGVVCAGVAWAGAVAGAGGVACPVCAAAARETNRREAAKIRGRITGVILPSQGLARFATPLEFLLRR